MSALGRKNLPRSPLLKSYSGFILVPRNREFPPSLVFLPNQADSSPGIREPFKSVDHQRVMACGVLSQRNPSRLGLAVFLVRDNNCEWIQEHRCDPLKVQPVLAEIG